MSHYENYCRLQPWVHWPEEVLISIPRQTTNSHSPLPSLPSRSPSKPGGVSKLDLTNSKKHSHSVDEMLHEIQMQCARDKLKRRQAHAHMETMSKHVRVVAAIAPRSPIRRDGADRGPQARVSPTNFVSARSLDLWQPVRTVVRSSVDLDTRLGRPRLVPRAGTMPSQFNGHPSTSSARSNLMSR